MEDVAGCGKMWCRGIWTRISCWLHCVWYSYTAMKQYTYPNLSMTANLDLNSIVQYLKEKVTNTYHAM